MRAHRSYRSVLTALLGWAVGWAGITSAVAASPLTRAATLEISVSGVVYTAPDEASISFAVAAVAPSTTEARAMVRPRAAQLIQRLKVNGVDERILVVNRNEIIEEVLEEWIENDELIEGKQIASRVQIVGSIVLTDMTLAERVVELLARQGIDVTFKTDYRLNAETAETATQQARADAVRRARGTAMAIAQRQGWRIAEMLTPRRKIDPGGAADLGGAATEDREWGPPVFLSPSLVATDYDLVVTFRLVR